LEASSAQADPVIAVQDSKPAAIAMKDLRMPPCRIAASLVAPNN